MIVRPVPVKGVPTWTWFKFERKLSLAVGHFSVQTGTLTWRGITR